uniref:Uncharacterized protein n=1 Tax=Arcella intermedia TaxID=1963864 RepID=A0A6B2LQZ5_9EUKA
MSLSFSFSLVSSFSLLGDLMDFSLDTCSLSLSFSFSLVSSFSLLGDLMDFSLVFRSECLGFGGEVSSLSFLVVGVLGPPLSLERTLVLEGLFSFLGVSGFLVFT